MLLGLLLAFWVLFDELALWPFYNMTADHPTMAPIVRDLWGIKPMRQASLLEMATRVITKQQISFRPRPRRFMLVC